MADQYRNYILVLDDLRFRRSEYQKMIAETDQAIAAIERIIRGSHTGNPPLSTNPGQQVWEQPPVVANTYARMTIGDAAVAFIRSLGPGPPQTTRSIVNGLRQGGLPSHSKNLYTTLFNVLTKRASLENGDLIKSGTRWTLREFEHR